MTEENIVQLPTLLERLAGKLKGCLTKEAANREEWIALQEDKCATLVEIRDQFPANIEFGQWCDTNGFGSDVINHQERAAAIAMGKEPEALHACLTATTRSSLEAIYRFEFDRFTNVRKTTAPRKQKDTGKPSPQMQRALDAYDTLKAHGEPITSQAIRDLANVSDTPVRRVLALKSEEAKLDPLTPAEMRVTQLKRYELAIKQARIEIRQELQNEVYKELDIFVARHKERIERAERTLAAYKGVMSHGMFRMIRACLHPDHNTFKFAAEALQAFSELEAVLVKPEPPASNAPPLPSTVAELMALRRGRR